MTLVHPGSVAVQADHPVALPITQSDRRSSGLRHLLAGLVTLVRPGQWTKNVLVVPVALLSAPDWTLASLGRIGWAILTFTIASALVYVVNDIADRERDLAHPTKCKRPVVSGQVPVPVAKVLGVVLAGVLVAVALRDPNGAWPIGLYLVLNVAYSLWLKHVPLVDVFTIALGFVLRTAAGYAATRLPVSPWLLLCVFAACLLLGLGKRRRELSSAEAGHRPALAGYSIGLVDHLIVLNSTVTVVSYLLFLDTQYQLAQFRSAALLASAPFALFGLCRYLQEVLLENGGGSPLRTLFGDRLMVGNLLLWAAVVGGCLLVAHYPGLGAPLSGF